jgi:tetratricopeptide (TPR) repeat protein
MADVNEMYKEAEQLKEEGKLEEAIGKLQQLLEQDEQHVLSHLTLAVLLGKVGNHEQAVRHAQRACELDPNDAFSFTALSVTYQRAYAGTGNQQYIQLAEEAMARSHMMQGH